MITKLPLLALTLLAACATSPLPEAQLAPSKWQVVSIDDAAPKSPRASFEILTDRISTSVGCNGLGGNWSTMDGRLIAGPFVSTMMYCDGLMEQERALAQLLESRPTYTFVNDQLVFEGGGHKLVLRKVR